MLSITLNGEPRSVRVGSSIADLAAEIGLDPTKVAVERNLEIVKQQLQVQFATLESLVSTLQQQSSFLTSALSGR